MRQNHRGLTTENNDDVISCEIVRLFEPPTMSCVMEVRLLSPDNNTRAVLKLYDRRFALQLRSEIKIEPPITTTEMAFGDFVKSGDAAEFLDRLRNDDDYEEPEEGWTVAQNETYLYDTCLDMFTAETMVYDKMKDLQGKELPYLFAEVSLSPSSSQEIISSSSSASENFFEINGILLEFIDGHTLSQIANIPRENWGFVCEEAVRTVGLLSDYSIRNKDVRPSNFMVSSPSTSSPPPPSSSFSPSESHLQGENPPQTPKKYRIIMLDFGQCIEREPHESDAEWGREKWRQDEEGALGLVMRGRLKRQFAYDWPFEHSLRFLPWASTEKDS